MDEERIHELSSALANKMIEHAKLKREKNKLVELNKAEGEIIKLRREINNELQKISGEIIPEINAEE